MSDEKRYTAREAAIAVLKKAEEVLKKSEVMKKGKVMDAIVGGFASAGAATAGQPMPKEASKELKKSDETENKKAPSNSEKPKIEEKQAEASDKAFETKPESAKSSDDARLAEQTAPEDNPKEAAEGNNEMWGTAPEAYGVLKLAHFMGRMDSKRKSKKAE